MSSTMTGIHIEPLDATFGAVIRGVNLAELDEPTFEALYQAWLEHALLIFPEQYLSNEVQVSFARRFGELEFDLAPLSNVGKDGTIVAEDDANPLIQVLKGNMGWHHDSTYMPVQARGAVFTAHVVPSEGGETGWADMRAAYDALDETTRRLVDDKAAYHSLYYSQDRAGFRPREGGSYQGYGFHDEPPPLRPLVKEHPETGRRNLVIGRHAFGIPGMSAAESETLLDELLDFACRPPRIYHHRWQPGDAVLWDNRCLMHRACPWDMSEPRVMYHARIAGDPASESGLDA